MNTDIKQRLSELKAVLFDLDGVIIDSEGIYTEIWDGIDKAVPSGVDDFAHVIKGSTLSEILNTYYPDPAQSQEVMQMLRQSERLMEYRLFDGVMDMLSDLRAKGIKTAIVTSSGGDKMRLLFAAQPQLADAVDLVITAGDVSRSKPDPEGYLIAAERLGAHDGNFAVVEDSFNGLEAGRRSGGLVIGIASTNPREKVEPLADITLDSSSEIKNLI